MANREARFLRINKFFKLRYENGCFFLIVKSQRYLVYYYITYNIAKLHKITNKQKIRYFNTVTIRPSLYTEKNVVLCYFFFAFWCKRFQDRVSFVYVFYDVNHKYSFCKPYKRKRLIKLHGQLLFLIWQYMTVLPCAICRQCYTVAETLLPHITTQSSILTFYYTFASRTVMNDGWNIFISFLSNILKINKNVLFFKCYYLMYRGILKTTRKLCNIFSLQIFYIVNIPYRKLVNIKKIFRLSPIENKIA